MKKIFYVLTFFICVLSGFICLFSGCSSKASNDLVAETMIDNTTYDTLVANEISSYKNANNFNEETIKTLAVIIRTNLYNSKLEVSQSQNLKIKNSEIYEIVKSTTGEIIADENETTEKLNFEVEDDYTKNSPTKNENLKKINSNDNLTSESSQNENNSNLDTWTVSIKKSKILEILKKHNIKLSSLAKTQIINDENGNAEKIIIGEKEFSFDIIQNEFNLPSNKIIDINNNLSTIKITGKNDEKYNNFSIDEINSLSNKENDYKNIIKSKKNSFKIINIQKNTVENF